MSISTHSHIHLKSSLHSIQGLSIRSYGSHSGTSDAPIYYYSTRAVCAPLGPQAVELGVWKERADSVYLSMCAQSDGEMYVTGILRLDSSADLAAALLVYLCQS